MKSQILFAGLLFALILFSSNCENTTSPTNNGGEYDLAIPLENRHYDLTDRSTDAFIYPKLINNSQETFYYLIPSYIITLQKMTGIEWKDRGAWYAIIQGGYQVKTLAPRDTLSMIRLDLQFTASNMDLIDSSGLYRFHFKLYREENLVELIPEADRVSDPFEVIL